MNTKGHELFISRLYDALDQCHRGKKAVLTSFLSPVEQELAKTILQNQADLWFWGGHEYAERAQLCLSMNNTSQTDVVCLHDSVQCSHAQVLGTLLHAGISRNAIGDILCTDTGIYLFCRSHMAPAIVASVWKINGEPVSLKEYEGPIPQINPYVLTRIQSTSCRLDAIVSALAHCSRSQAAEKIRQGWVKVDDVVISENVVVRPGQFLSIRKTGRFRFVQEAGTTRKGKLILELNQYS